MMNEKTEVVIVLMRCSHLRSSSGMRFEKRAEQGWAGTWAFKLREASAKREGFDKNVIEGAISFDVAYPGCPYCNARSIFQCECGKVGCWDGETRSVTCPWCGQEGELQGHIQSLSAEADR